MPVVNLESRGEARELLRTSLIDYCLAHGLVVRPQPNLSDNPHSCLVAHAPVALYPTEFPRHAFQHAKLIQRDYNDLYAKIAMDIPFLTRIMEDLKHVDDFMKALWELYLDVKDDVRGLTLGLFRSDYLLHGKLVEQVTIKQVEFNTISASFASLAAKTADAHRAMLSSGMYHQENLSAENLPENDAMRGLANGLAVAHNSYKSSGNGPTGVIFIVQAGERNAFDQRWLEYTLLEHHGIRSWRVPFTEVQELLNFDSATKRLTIQDPVSMADIEASVIYYRAGYGPEDYPSQKEWASRKMLELSSAIKCPSLITQLAGSKKVQQVLSESGILETFVTRKSAEALRSTFVGMHTLDSTPAGQEAIELALQKPERYVLKPQREGGGHNIYRSAIPDFLRSIPKHQWSGYILMELIEPPDVHNAIVRAGQIFPASVISELGIYGSILWNPTTKEILHNEEAGHLLRTKSKETDEGGVAAGFACIDSPYLV